MLGFYCKSRICVPLCLVLGLLLPHALRAAPARPGDVTLGVAAEDFEFQGDWASRSDLKEPVLMVGPGPATHPAATAVRVPRAGRYRLWVRARDYPDDRPGTRTFAVAVAGRSADHRFGTSGKPGYTWEDGGWFELPAGPVLIALEQPHAFARAQGILLTTSASLTPPAKPIGGPGGLPATKVLPVGEQSAGADAPLRITGEHPMAELANDRLKIDFLAANRAGESTVAVRAWVKSGDAWIDAGADASGEAYYAITADQSATLGHAGFYPTWERGDAPEPVKVEAGGASVMTTPGKTTRALWQAGQRTRLIPARAAQEGADVRLTFHPSPAGALEALWSLPHGQQAASVSLSFTPAADGQVALGYELFARRDLAQTKELLLPMLWQRHRLPDRPTTLLDNCMPTPLALIEPAIEADHPSTATAPAEAATHPTTQPGAAAAAARPRCFAIVGEPADAPFAWPDGRDVRFGMSIADAAGRVHPSIWGPVIGTSGAAVKRGAAVRLRFRVLVQAGDWYAGYRTAADEIDALTDYRSNVRTSLTDATLNMIDLVMDDEHGGWWDRAKAWYQIESKNGASHCSPMTLLSLYRLTGNEQIYRQRALPMMQFMLSRDGPHFSPVPDDTGPLYPAGSMNGPSRLFGTSTYAGLWELAGRRTDAFRAIALPEHDVRFTAANSHGQAFDQWLARYEVTQDAGDLERACALADRYIRTQIQTPPAKDLGPNPFFYISFVPDWEGLLRLYEVSGRTAYLDAAAFGARQLMTGIWTQPLIPDGPTTVHPHGVFFGDAHHPWWKGAVPYRLGWPPAPGAIVKHSVPAWQVSNVGLGFEQPVTFNPSGAARQIFEEQWAPHFLRLYRYTGDAAFLTYARNATVGRWGNYPGYYVTGHTDLPQDPRYPLTGPDVTDIYYHHIPAHLAWTIDYLVSEAEVLSNGQIQFPSLRQHGYAYFDSRIFGHAPGHVFDDDGAWLIFRRGLVTLDNVQVNHLVTHGPGGVDVILTNQSHAAQTVTVALSPEMLKFDPKKPIEARLRVGSEGECVKVTLEEGRTTVALPPRGLAVLTAPGLTLDVPAQRPPAPVAPGAQRDPVQTLDDPVAPTRSAALQAEPGAWDAYVWSTASSHQARSATLHYAIGDAAWQTIGPREYPFEFDAPVPDENASVRLKLDLIRTDGTPADGSEQTLSLRRTAPMPQQ